MRRTENILAPFGIAGHRHGVRVVRSYDDQRVLFARRIRGARHGFREFHRLVQRYFGESFMVGLVDECALDEQYEAVRFLLEHLDGLRGHFTQRGLRVSV